MLKPIYWSHDNEWFTFDNDDWWKTRNVLIGEGTENDIDDLNNMFDDMMAHFFPFIIAAAKERLVK